MQNEIKLTEAQKRKIQSRDRMKQASKLLAERCEKIESEFKQLANGKDATFLFGERKIASVLNQTSQRIDGKGLREVFPAIAAQFTTTTASFVFRNH